VLVIPAGLSKAPVVLPGKLDFTEELCAAAPVVLTAEDSARAISVGFIMDSLALTDKPSGIGATEVAFINTAWVLAISDETGDVCVALPVELNAREAVSTEDSVALPDEDNVLLMFE